MWIRGRIFLFIAMALILLASVPGTAAADTDIKVTVTSPGNQEYLCSTVNSEMYAPTVVEKKILLRDYF